MVKPGTLDVYARIAQLGWAASYVLAAAREWAAQTGIGLTESNSDGLTTFHFVDPADEIRYTEALGRAMYDAMVKEME